MSEIQIIRLERRPFKYSVQRCKDILKFARGVMSAFSTGNFAHSDDQLYLCERKSCECAEHVGNKCTGKSCQCTRHFSAFLCDEKKCPSVRFDRYIGCKATGCIINADLHVCHRACPHLLNDKNRGFVCQISGNYFEEAQLYYPEYTFKIDAGLVESCFNDNGADDRNGAADEDDLDDQEISGHRSSDPTEKDGAESKRVTNKARRPPRRLTSEWRGKHLTAQSDFDCIRVAMLSAAKTVVGRVLAKPQVLDGVKFIQLITAACHYYVQYRINDSPPSSRSAPRLLLDQTAQLSKRSQGNAIRAPYHVAIYESEETQDRTDSGYRYRRSVVSGHRKPRKASNENQNILSGELGISDDNTCHDADRDTAASRRSNKNTNMRMFDYFVLGFVQGCLTEDPNFPRMSLNHSDFVDLKQWHLRSRIINRNVTRFTTAIANAMETGRISEWDVNANRSLYLPPEVLQWNDWRS